MERLRRIERLVRSTIFGTPFVVGNLLTRYEIEGQHNLERALVLRDRQRSGMISISNHLSLFDDPLVHTALLGIKHFTNETKIWWSTPCESNFNPHGAGLAPRLVRAFSEVSNMVFFARPSKRGQSIELPQRYGPVMAERGGQQLMQRLRERCAGDELDLETFLSRFLTQPPLSSNHLEDRESLEHMLAPLNQPGMIEACARIHLGDWVHFFPEGTRSRTIHLKKPKRGIGKVMLHNPDAVLLPFCFYGTQDMMPVEKRLPRPFQRVVVTLGEPILAHDLLSGDFDGAPIDAFQQTAEAAWQKVRALRPRTLARYLGPVQAKALLRAEAPAMSTPAGEAVADPTRQTPRPERADKRRPGKVAQHAPKGS